MRTCYPILSIILVIFLSGNVNGQYSGLRFSGHEVSLDQRTGLDLTQDRHLDVKHSLDLSFDIKFQPNQASYFGYIFRAIIDQKNIDLVHRIPADSSENFQIIIGKNISGISFHIPMSKLESEWTTLRFKADFDDKKLSCFVKGKVLEDSLPGFDKHELTLFFGEHIYKHFATTDVPNMNIRNIRIVCDDNREYFWPLDQIQGNTAVETNHKFNGRVKNPLWLRTLHYNWSNPLNKEVDGLCQVAFDEKDDILYFVTDDSVFSYNVADHSLSAIKLSGSHKVVNTASLIYDDVHNELISYSIDQNYISVFNFADHQWTREPADTSMLTVFWHHNHVISPEGTLYTFAGYGQHKYNNMVFRFDTASGTWDTIHYWGQLKPRYLAGGGYHPGDSLFYLIGGYGTENGDQLLKPDYYYDILTYSFADSIFKSIYEFKEIPPDFSFGNSLYIDTVSDCVYGLLFTKYKFDNKLQLVKIPLKHPEIIKVGTEIDYKFLDIKSFADLFYSPNSNKLLTVTTYYDNNKTNLSIHAISFPPQEIIINPENPALKEAFHKYKAFLILGALIILLVTLFLYRRKGKKKGEMQPVKQDVRINDQSYMNIPYTMPENRKLQKGSIILFGGFQVIDNEGKDITGQFTPLLKKIFLFIMINSINHDKGISSNQLNEVFWFDKTSKSARNNRAVNIRKLRTILESVGESKISKETGYWKFDFNPHKTYIDYYELFKLVKSENTLSKEEVNHLLNIIKAGSFLTNTQEEWLDPLKSDVSNDIVDTLLKYANQNDDDPEFLIQIINCVFLFDIASEEAMILKCRLLVKLGKHSLAKNTYVIFIKEYKTLYDEDYSHSFNQIIRENFELT